MATYVWRIVGDVPETQDKVTFHVLGADMAEAAAKAFALDAETERYKATIERLFEVALDIPADSLSVKLADLETRLAALEEGK